MQKALKYNIKTRLLALPMSSYYDVRNKIVTQCDITPQTLRNWTNITIDSETTIKGPYLDIIAGIFNVPAIELFVGVPAPVNK